MLESLGGGVKGFRDAGYGYYRIKLNYRMRYMFIIWEFEST